MVLAPKNKQKKKLNKSKSKKDKVSPKSKDKDLIEIVVEEISFMCPKRGLVKQKVKVKRFKSLFSPKTDVVSTSDSTSVIESADDGLHIYSDSEDAE